MRSSIAISILASALLMGACGGSDVSEETAAEPPVETSVEQADVTLENGMTVSEMIDTRQDNLKDMAAAFKFINDEMKSGEPDMDGIKDAAATVASYSDEIGSWFPEGTGSASGVKTDALDTIWSDPDGFEAAVARFQTAAADLDAAAQAGDLEAFQATIRPTGMSCKNCHETFRADDD